MNPVLVQKAVIRKGNKYLVMLRSPKAELFPEHWDFPGGKLEKGEEAFFGVEREVAEETSLKIKAMKVAGEYEMIVNEILHRFIVYITELISGDVEISHEHTDFKWLTREEILKLRVEPYIKLYFEGHP